MRAGAGRLREPGTGLGSRIWDQDLVAVLGTLAQDPSLPKRVHDCKGSGNARASDFVLF